MYDFSPMMKLVKEGKSSAEAWEETRDQILAVAKKGTWNRDKFVSDPIDDIESGKLGFDYVTTGKIDPKDLCDNALIQGVLEELDAVVQRSRMFQHKPDGEVSIRYLQDGRGTPAPVQQVSRGFSDGESYRWMVLLFDASPLPLLSPPPILHGCSPKTPSSDSPSLSPPLSLSFCVCVQDPLFYPHGTKWMAPGPVGQTYSLPDDEGLKKHLTKVAENYHKVYKMYNLPWDEGNNSLLADPEMKKAQAFWPEEFFQEGPNSAWWYKNVLYPLEKKVEEDVKYHTEQDQQEYRKKGKNALKRNWLDRSKSMIDAFFSKKSWEVRTKEDAEKFEMVKDFVKDCDDIGFMSSWKVSAPIEPPPLPSSSVDPSLRSRALFADTRALSSLPLS